MNPFNTSILAKYEKILKEFQNVESKSQFIADI